jgi:hypothetical protein
MDAVPFDAERWSWEGAEPVPAEHLGRACFALGTATGWVGDVELRDGTIELELAVGAERGFHGVCWRGRGDTFETFFVRPHQVGNPDAVQYTPVWNGVFAWQLYTGPGSWAPVEFPLDEWFRIRVVFAGPRAEIFVADLEEPALVVGELRLPAEPGRVGVIAGGVGGPPVHVAGLAVDERAELRRPAPPREPVADGVVRRWWVSDAFPEHELTTPGLDLAGRTWTELESEPSGLANLARTTGIRDGRDTVLARATIDSPRAQTVELELGFSDRAVVYLNGRALFRGADAYRSRDYRFLGSIGWYDAVYLPLVEGENELVVAVSEDFGGWGVQARFPGGLPR